MRWEDYYQLGKPWHGMDNYECKLCPYSTVDGIKAMMAHLITHFPTKPKSEIVIADSSGKVLGSADEIFAADEEE